MLADMGRETVYPHLDTEVMRGAFGRTDVRGWNEWCFSQIVGGESVRRSFGR